MEDWKVTLTSTHRGALNRQVTEAVTISNEGLSNLLNSKMEFGANNLSEIGVKKGHFLVGEKRKRRDDEEKKEECDKKQENEKEEKKPEKAERKEVKRLIRSTVYRDVPGVPNKGEDETDVKHDVVGDDDEKEVMAAFKKLRVSEGNTAPSSFIYLKKEVTVATATVEPMEKKI